MRAAARLKILANLLFLAIFASACISTGALQDPLDQLILKPGSALWDTPATQESLSKGGLTLEKPYPREGTIWVFTGKSQAALASRPLPLEPGKRYRLSLWLRRDNFVNDHYLWLNFFGREHRLDAHCVVGGWQKLTIIGIAPADGQGIIVIRNHSGSRLMLAKAALQLLPTEPALSPARPLARQGHFPVGAYLNRTSQMATAAACGLDTVVLGAPLAKQSAMLVEAQRLNLTVILPVSSNPATLQKQIRLLRGLAPSLRPGGFYMQDEPEIRSYPLERMIKARRDLQHAFPTIPVVTAIVRPRAVEQYAAVYDAVFMDQYPVPSQPLNWLADSVAIARGLVRPDGQVWAVVQAFGGGKFAKMGWPRLPHPQEMNALAASALTSGAQGLLFYDWQFGSADASLGPAICQLVTQIRHLRPWLPLSPGLPPGMKLKYLGRVRTDPGGGPAVRTGWASARQGTMVLLVNTTNFTAEVALSPVDGQVRQLWQGGILPSTAGQVRFFLPSRQVRAWLLP